MPARPFVLLVDDDEDVRLMTRVNLDFEGFDVAEARDGFEAMERARSEVPDAIVLDVMMPGRDGLSVLREIRGDAALSGIPVILLTALGDASAQAQGYEAGATAYVTKPFTVAALAATLRQLLAGGGREPRESAQARLDVVRRFTRGGNPPAREDG